MQANMTETHTCIPFPEVERTVLRKRIHSDSPLVTVDQQRT